MLIQNIDVSTYTNNSNVRNTIEMKKDFQKLYDKLSNGKIAEEIQENYDVTLHVDNVSNVNQILSAYDMHCKNVVCIPQATLTKMEENPVLKKKVLTAIEEFCSPEEQAEINALQPPVKSAGMLVYPDGRIMYWLEGYPNNFEDMKDKKIVILKESIRDVCQCYGNNDVENDIESAMQILGTSVNKEKRFDNANFNIFKDEESWWQNRNEDFREIIENRKREILEDDYDWWTERMLRHKMFMQLRLTGEIDTRLLMDLKNNTASSYVLSLFSPQLSQEELEEKKRIEKEHEEKLDIL